MAVPGFLSSIVGWLRAGYPNGVPTNDYIPLLALLRRRLTEDEVRQVAADLVDDGVLPVEKADIGVLITKVLDDMPLEGDMQRVRERLIAVGWVPEDTGPEDTVDPAAG
ncbi:DUF3349 domain-containing protein [Skermania piniformis]|uniref:DUF3349 domain-containing protein n=1 Tax=Skermania pinensis TaxID=39122 RepID=A0ABX8SB98_9ACTN|nr:DUF3349 domain-containing protein [Skermania piniformis]QXQ14457.1 DUF3349 domain-containing protein [Skermania piniformis]